MAAQVEGALRPIGVTAPIPVMATRRGGLEKDMAHMSHNPGQRQVFDFAPPL